MWLACTSSAAFLMMRMTLSDATCCRSVGRGRQGSPGVADIGVPLSLFHSSARCENSACPRSAMAGGRALIPALVRACPPPSRTVNARRSRCAIKMHFSPPHLGLKGGGARGNQEAIDFQTIRRFIANAGDFASPGLSAVTAPRMPSPRHPLTQPRPCCWRIPPPGMIGRRCCSERCGPFHLCRRPTPGLRVG